MVSVILGPTRLYILGAIEFQNYEVFYWLGLVLPSNLKRCWLRVQLPCIKLYVGIIHFNL